MYEHMYALFSSYVNFYIIITYNFRGFFFKRLLISLKKLNIHILNVLCRWQGFAKEYLYHTWLLVGSICRNRLPVFPHSCLTTRFITRVTQCAPPPVKQELLTPQEHLYSLWLIVGLVLLDSWFSVNYFVDHPLYFRPLYCLSFELRLLINPLVYVSSRLSWSRILLMYVLNSHNYITSVLYLYFWRMSVSIVQFTVNLHEVSKLIPILQWHNELILLRT